MIWRVEKGDVLGWTTSDERVEYSGHVNERGDISSDDGYERGDITGDDGICRFRFQDIRHYYFHINGESVGGYGRGGYRSQTRYSYSNNPGERGIFLCVICCLLSFSTNFKWR